MRTKDLLKGKKHFTKKLEAMKKRRPSELTLGERLTLLRIENGYTNQETFGELFSLSKSAINNYENDIAKPDYNTLTRIAQTFHVSHDYLFGATDSKVQEHYDVAEKLGLSDEAINKLTQYNESFMSIQIINYFLESELTPALVELLKRYVDAVMLSLEGVTDKDLDNFISADAYLTGIANEDSIKFALIRCFSDIIEGAPAIRLIKQT